MQRCDAPIGNLSCQFKPREEFRSPDAGGQDAPNPSARACSRDVILARVGMPPLITGRPLRLPERRWLTANAPDIAPVP
jgi:hypothetical protein